MTEHEITHIETALRKAVEAAIAKVGIAGLKETSFFLTNERPALRKAA